MRIGKLKEATKDQVLALLVGGMLGDGAHRRVYEVPGRPDVVLKVERFGRTFANVKEWDVWDYLQWDPKASRWLAPCLDISQEGDALLQRRCRDLTDAEWAAVGPVPAWLSDTKRDNWGWLEDGPDSRPVMRDYSLTRLHDRGARRARLVPKMGD